MMIRNNTKLMILLVLTIACGLLFLHWFHLIEKKETKKSSQIKRGGVLKIHCKGSPFVVPTVYTHGTEGWTRDCTICAKCFNCMQVTLKTRFGNTPICIYNAKYDTLVSSKLQQNGVFDPEKLALIYAFMKIVPDLNFIDIGANIGSLSLPVAKFGRKVLAVEALYLNLQHVCASLMAGTLQQHIYLVHNAVSDGHAEVRLRAQSKNMGGTFVDIDTKHVRNMKNNQTQGTYGYVRTIRMDDLLGLPIISEFQRVFIKIDIEGSEARALKNAHKLFRKLDVRAVLLEWVFHKGMPTAHTIIEFMKMHNYEPFTFDKFGPISLNITKHSDWPHDVLWLPSN